MYKRPLCVMFHVSYIIPYVSFIMTLIEWNIIPKDHLGTKPNQTFTHHQIRVTSIFIILNVSSPMSDITCVLHHKELQLHHSQSPVTRHNVNKQFKSSRHMVRARWPLAHILLFLLQQTFIILRNRPADVPLAGHHLVLCSDQHSFCTP